MKNRSILILIILVSYSTVFAQRTIRGKVIDETFQVLPDVSIFNQDTLKFGTTDFNGNFEITIPNEDTELIFAWLMHEWSNVSVPENCTYLEVILLQGSTYDFMSSRKVDKLRKKQFDELPYLHKKAVEKGIFETERPCFEENFVPAKPRLDKIAQEMEKTKKQLRRTFRKFSVGDTVKVPSESWSAYTDNISFDCLIIGTIIGKNRRKSSYNLILRVTGESCEEKEVTYNGQLIRSGDTITHNMKYFKIVKE